MWTAIIKTTTEKALFSSIIAYIQIVTHIFIWYYVRYVTVPPFDIYQLGFSVSPSSHPSDQQNLGSNSCNALKERKWVFKFLPHHAASHYIQSSFWVILTYAHGMKMKLTSRLSLEKSWSHHYFSFVDYLYFIDLNAFLLMLVWSLFFPLNSSL